MGNKARNSVCDREVHREQGRKQHQLFLLQFLTPSIIDGLGPFPTQIAPGYSVYHNRKNTKAGLFKELGSHLNYPVCGHRTVRRILYSFPGIYTEWLFFSLKATTLPFQHYRGY